MNPINFNNKSFRLLENSTNGKVNSETIFKYKQEGDLVTADYAGGTIIYGKVVAYLEDDKLQMRYNCLTTDKELKAGKATAKISTTQKGKIQLTLNWKWLDQNQGLDPNQGLDQNRTGTSTYIEI